MRIVPIYILNDVKLNDPLYMRNDAGIINVYQQQGDSDIMIGSVFRSYT